MGCLLNADLHSLSPRGRLRHRPSDEPRLPDAMAPLSSPVSEPLVGPGPSRAPWASRPVRLVTPPAPLDGPRPQTYPIAGLSVLRQRDAVAPGADLVLSYTDVAFGAISSPTCPWCAGAPTVALATPRGRTAASPGWAGRSRARTIACLASGVCHGLVSRQGRWVRAYSTEAVEVRSQPPEPGADSTASSHPFQYGTSVRGGRSSGGFPRRHQPTRPPSTPRALQRRRVPAGSAEGGSAPSRIIRWRARSSSPATAPRSLVAWTRTSERRKCAAAWWTRRGTPQGGGRPRRQRGHVLVGERRDRWGGRPKATVSRGERGGRRSGDRGDAG